MAEAQPSDPPAGSHAFPDLAKFDGVSEMLDKNKRIMDEIKANHEAQKPEGLAKNFALIREFNGNLEKVMQAYKDIADDFSGFMQQHPNSNGPSGGAGDATS